MYCPQCGVEYRAGFTECSDCHVPLSAETPAPESVGPSTPLLGLVVVLETNDRIQLALAKGLLEDAGIPFFALGQIVTLIQDLDPFLHKWVRLQVPRDREVEARELLEPLLEGEASPQLAGEEE
jgi:Putative prokaryotic signal transducing protein